jgi:hypothetical protein
LACITCSIFIRKQYSLTPSSKYMKNSIKHLSVWYNRSTYSLEWLFFRYYLLNLVPQFISNGHDGRMITNVFIIPNFPFYLRDTGHSLASEIGSYNSIEFWDRLLVDEKGNSVLTDSIVIRDITLIK